MPEFEIGDYAFFFDWRQFMRYAVWFTILLIVLRVSLTSHISIIFTSILLIALAATTYGPSQAALRRELQK